MDVFEKLEARRQQQARLSVPRSLASPLSADERDGLALWIRGQRTMPHPERRNWLLFWNGSAPFFSRELSLLLLGQVSANILQCADPVRDPSLLENWKLLDPGQRFVFGRIDACRCQFFDADFLLIMDRQRTADAWCFGPQLEPDGSRGKELVWRSIEVADALETLLYTWELAQPKAKFARERLCDIADKALGQRP